ncbi:Dig1p PWA37_000933 [Arxiozyma heterogenica]|uniref:Uncharacterized protein n=1 Tax=Arxiozyma heterogenica TaxID=278026 RepID=A0AAN7WLM3_9SACH|nr:hypothetical protein RI543_002846 [Kazachstania heterogenica]
MRSNLRNKTQDNNSNSSSNSDGGNSNSSCKLKKLEVTPIEETRQDTDVSSTTTIHSPNVTENIVSNDSINTNIDSNLIVKASADGKIEDIISPVAITDKKPFQKDLPEDKNKTPSSSTSSVISSSFKGSESERLNKDRLSGSSGSSGSSSSSSSSSSSVQNLITNKMNQTSLKRKQIPPPLGIQPGNKIQNKNQHQHQHQQNLQNRIQDKYRGIDVNQNLKKPRVRYLGKVPLTKKYSRFSTIPYLRNKMKNHNAYSLYPSQKLQNGTNPLQTSAQSPLLQQQQQCLFPTFSTHMVYPTSAIQPSQLPNFFSSLSPSPVPAPFTAPFSTSNTPYMASISPCHPYSYYYQNYYRNIHPNSNAPINPDMIDPTLFLNSVPPYLQYDDIMKHHHYNDGDDNEKYSNNNEDIGQATESEYSLGLKAGNTSSEFETKMGKNGLDDNKIRYNSVQKDEKDDDGDDSDDNNNIEESDLAIEEGAVPTPIFTKFQHDTASVENRNSVINNNSVIFGEIKILDNQYSFEYLQRSNRDVNKKIFMSICNQIWNECHR